MTTANDIAWLKAQVQQLQRRLDARPVRQRSPINVIYQIVIDQGNVLTSGQNGIKSATVSTVPAAYDPNSTTSFVDGVGRGQLYINAVLQTGYVLVVNDPARATGATGYALVTGDIVYSPGPIGISVGGGPSSVMIYPAAFV